MIFFLGLVCGFIVGASLTFVAYQWLDGFTDPDAGPPWLGRTCPPCDGQCQQGRKCPARESK